MSDCKVWFLHFDSNLPHGGSGHVYDSGRSWCCCLPLWWHRHSNGLRARVWERRRLQWLRVLDGVPDRCWLEFSSEVHGCVVAAKGHRRTDVHEPEHTADGRCEQASRAGRGDHSPETRDVPAKGPGACWRRGLAHLGPHRHPQAESLPDAPGYHARYSERRDCQCSGSLPFEGTRELHLAVLLQPHVVRCCLHQRPVDGVGYLLCPGYLGEVPRTPIKTAAQVSSCGLAGPCESAAAEED